MSNDYLDREHYIMVFLWYNLNMRYLIIVYQIEVIEVSGLFSLHMELLPLLDPLYPGIFTWQD